ncbi:hypothetical protein [Streptomyces sp. NPDC007346]|uniref:hypothetical protein n=1 Tax=Streptomyces sp. NPDC007346 TaxID=3154682 RepID=UPI0034573A71
MITDRVIADRWNRRPRDGRPRDGRPAGRHPNRVIAGLMTADRQGVTVTGTMRASITRTA